MNYRTLGTTDITVSTVALGCWSLVGGFNWGHQDPADSIGAIETSLDEGVTFFDTAPAYGDGASERLLGEVLGSRRTSVAVATKVLGTLSRESVIRGCEESLARLQTDYIDLYQLHWPDWQTPIERAIEALELLAADGKIRAHGLSNFGPADLAEATDRGAFVSDQLPYSLLWRPVEHQVQGLCVERNIGILCYSALMQGLLTGKFRSADEVPVDRARTRHFSKDCLKTRHDEAGCEELTFETLDRIRGVCERRGVTMPEASLAWLLQQPAVTAVIAGARNADQARQNARCAQTVLAPEVGRELTDVTEDLKARLGGNVDQWMSRSRIR